MKIAQALQSIAQCRDSCRERLPGPVSALKLGFKHLLSGCAGRLGTEGESVGQQITCLALLLQHVLHHS